MLLLIGHAGKKFWDVFQSRIADEVMLKPDPVDRYSRDITAEALEKHLPNINKWLLFPADDCPINLMALGRAFNWHTPSPLGMGIHWNYGLWSAYRAVWWVDVECEGQVSESQVKSPATDICSQCETQECVASCPADAIQYRENPDLSSCADYRLQDSSQCESTCLARMACPYAGEHRYIEQQMAYHYELSRSSIADYRREKQQ